MKRLVGLSIVATISMVLPSMATARYLPPVRPSIAGGYTPAATAWPWTTWITAPGYQNCTATLIAPKRLLTAAHCVYGDAGTILPASAWDAYIDRRNATTLPGEERKITAVVADPLFTGEGSGDYDAAIMFLDSPVTDVSPAPLGTATDWGQAYGTGCGANRNEVCYQGAAMGWGRIDYNDSTPTTQLQAGIFTLGSDSDCNAWIDDQPNPINTYDANTQFCAYNAQGTTCITHGDSGGPFMVFVGGQWVQIGVTSHFPSRITQGSCKASELIVAETWVAGPSMRNWITSVTNPACPGAQAWVSRDQGLISGDQTSVMQDQASVKRDQSIANRDRRLVSRASKQVRRLKRQHHPNARTLRRTRGALAKATRNLRTARARLGTASRHLAAAKRDLAGTQLDLGKASQWDAEVCTG